MNTADMARLAEENAGLVRKVAAQYLRLCEKDRAISLDDLIQSGTLAVWEAAGTYNPDGGKTWAAWAAWYISNACKAAFGTRNGRDPASLHTVSYDAPLTDDETLLDLTPDEESPKTDERVLLDELCETVRAAVNSLPPAERDTIRGKWFDGQTYAQIAKSAGTDAAHVRRADERGQERLRKTPAIIHLARAYNLDQITRFYAYKGLSAYNRDWTSTVEAAVLWRESQTTAQEAAQADKNAETMSYTNNTRKRATEAHRKPQSEE